MARQRDLPHHRQHHECAQARRRRCPSAPPHPPSTPQPARARQLARPRRPPAPLQGAHKRNAHLPLGGAALSAPRRARNRTRQRVVRRRRPLAPRWPGRPAWPAPAFPRERQRQLRIGWHAPSRPCRRGATRNTQTVARGGGDGITRGCPHVCARGRKGGARGISLARAVSLSDAIGVDSLFAPCGFKL